MFLFDIPKTAVYPSNLQGKKGTGRLNPRRNNKIKINNFFLLFNSQADRWLVFPTCQNKSDHIKARGVTGWVNRVASAPRAIGIYSNVGNFSFFFFVLFFISFHFFPSFFFLSFLFIFCYSFIFRAFFAEFDSRDPEKCHATPCSIPSMCVFVFVCKSKLLRSYVYSSTVYTSA